MSRSRKKHPYIKDGTKKMRQVLHRAVRSKYRQISKLWVNGWHRWQRYDEWEWELYDRTIAWHEDPEYPDSRSIVNDYDIVDWKFIDKVKGYRK